MEGLFKKLNFKAQPCIHVLDAPASFEQELPALGAEVAIRRSVQPGESVVFAIAFATQQQQVDQIAHTVCPQLEGDAVLWIAYPKGSSKKYTCDFNRDTGWSVLGQYQMEPVRQVAIDADWSALRFRKISHIKQFTRHAGMILSEEGKARQKKNSH